MRDYEDIYIYIFIWRTSHMWTSSDFESMETFQNGLIFYTVTLLLFYFHFNHSTSKYIKMIIQIIKIFARQSLKIFWCLIIHVGIVKAKSAGNDIIKLM